MAMTTVIAPRNGARYEENMKTVQLEGIPVEGVSADADGVLSDGYELPCFCRAFTPVPIALDRSVEDSLSDVMSVSPGLPCWP